MKKLIYILIVSALLPLYAGAQTAGDEVKLVYSHQKYGGVIVHSHGWGLNFNYGKHKGVKKLLTFGGDFATLRHGKEIRAFNNSAGGGAGSYFYGKLNSIFLLRPHIGKRTFRTQKLRANGLEVGWNWELGPSIALAKPVYLEIGFPKENISSSREERYDPNKHDVDNILGRASAFRGINEIKPFIGAHAKFSFLFEYSDVRDRTKGLEAGIALDIFPQKLPILAEGLPSLQINRNRAIFPTFFVNFFIGKKYTKR